MSHAFLSRMIFLKQFTVMFRNHSMGRLVSKLGVYILLSRTLSDETHPEITVAADMHITYKDYNYNGLSQPRFGLLWIMQ